MENSSTIGLLVIASSVLSLLCLLILHFVSPEFKPAWRMISEYALGKQKWLLTTFFVCWSISNILAAYLYLLIVSSNWGIVAALLVFISGIGALMGGLFDLKHKLHGLSFALGVPTFPIGALIVVHRLCLQNEWYAYQSDLLMAGYSVLISLVLMGITMVLFFSGLKKAGIPFGPDQPPLTKIPTNVIAFNGYANRLLVIVYVAFNMVVSYLYLRYSILPFGPLVLNH